MKSNIHPAYVATKVSCVCGNTFETRSTMESINVEICSACHPFYTGKQKFVDTAGRVEKFQQRFAWKEDSTQQVLSDADKQREERRAAVAAKEEEQRQAISKRKKANEERRKSILERKQKEAEAKAAEAAAKEEAKAAEAAKAEAAAPAAETPEAPAAEATETKPEGESSENS